MKPKEQAIKDFKDMIQKSWTYEKFTQREQENYNNLLDCIENENRLIGNYKQRWDQLNNIYTAFLSALDYKPFGWRE